MPWNELQGLRCNTFVERDSINEACPNTSRSFQEKGDYIVFQAGNIYTLWYRLLPFYRQGYIVPAQRFAGCQHLKRRVCVPPGQLMGEAQTAGMKLREIGRVCDE